MTKQLRPLFSELANQQGAAALLAATFEFLGRNRIPRKMFLEAFRQHRSHQESSGDIRRYKRLVRAYEEMGTVMSTWFSLPRFLDANGLPIRLTATKGLHSIRSLVLSSRVKVSATLAIELMRRSTSVRVDAHGRFIALKRVFVLPDFEVPRAALVISRYLEPISKLFEQNA